ncbi:MAG: type IV conjugative transfer system protein TraE [Alphaproteobacteria bacterium]|nr:type IV conjugative transfer system protein TraE [Alphaproteobacteria bacterium]
MRLKFFKEMVVIQQRNLLALLCLGLLLSNIILVSLSGNSHVILVPPEITKTFWVDREEVSPEYLEQMASFLVHEILDVTPQSASRQRDLILKYVAPSFYNAFRKRLLKEEELLQKEQASTSFKITQITIDQKITITGIMDHYVASLKVKSAQETYEMTFIYKGGRLLLSSFEPKGQEND